MGRSDDGMRFGVRSHVTSFGRQPVSGLRPRAGVEAVCDRQGVQARVFKKFIPQLDVAERLGAELPTCGTASDTRPASRPNLYANT